MSSDSAKMRVLVVDDERAARDGLVSMLSSLAERFGLEVVGEANDGVEALGRIHELQPYAVFLDVRMPGMDGFEVLSHLRHEVQHVVFVTAYHDFAIRAFDVGAVDYLLKPFGLPRLEKALERLRLRFEQERAEGEPSSVIPTLPKRLIGRRGNVACLVDTEDILAVEAAANYVHLHTADDRFLLRASLSKMSARLAPIGIIRTHRSWLVRASAVRAFAKAGSGDLTLTLANGMDVPLSRTYRPDFEQLLKRLT